MYTVYVLKSQIARKSYVGMTDDLERRLAEHNKGKSAFTKRYRPWEVLYTEEFEYKKDALKKEKYFKSSAGRKYLKIHVFNK